MISLHQKYSGATHLEPLTSPIIRLQHYRQACKRDVSKKCFLILSFIMFYLQAVNKHMHDGLFPPIWKGARSLGSRGTSIEIQT